MHEFWNKVLINFQGGSVLTVGLVITAIVILLVGLVLSSWFTRLLGRRLERARVNADTRAAIQKLLFIFLMVGVSLTALGVLQVPLTAFTFLSGAVAIGIGFGAQNIINNFISGWILMSERPLRIGDFVEIDSNQIIFLQRCYNFFPTLTSLRLAFGEDTGTIFIFQIINIHVHRITEF